jgi:hypothetical protein
MRISTYIDIEIFKYLKQIGTVVSKKLTQKFGFNMSVWLVGITGNG